MSEKILLVEDETKIARTVRLYLEEAGYQVEVVNDGALAMPAFRALGRLDPRSYAAAAVLTVGVEHAMVIDHPVGTPPWRRRH